ncbi:hypothetical protein ACQUW5_06155 [Legionella sp. CNM-1927-20]|uniref:hypothetical protein n=1 Tax=Legionella sp. CNM-1927-20 TaxID=3422221 RepID=UPI00403AEFAC
MINSSKSKWNNVSKNDIELFKLINNITLSNNCPYFLIGAKARDILLEFYGKNAAQRATLDIDIAKQQLSYEDALSRISMIEKGLND